MVGISEIYVLFHSTSKLSGKSLLKKKKEKKEKKVKVQLISKA
jgi:hypothetical protein